MPKQAAGLIPIVQRSYDLCAELYGHVNRFPRAERGLLGRVILDDALRMLVGLTAANRRSDRRELLADASGRLDALRITLRLSRRLGYLPNAGYERVTKAADEVGRMLGGWMKFEAASGKGAENDQLGRGQRDLPFQEKVPATANVVAPQARRGGTRYSMTSPTIEKYLRMKLGHPEEVVFVTVGAFCQTFFEDALLCGRELKFAVRDVAARTEPERIPACGFPRSRLEKVRASLQQSGRAVHAE